MIIELATDDIRVHARATDVLADLINDQQVTRANGQAGQPAARQPEQFHFPFEEVLWGHGLNEPCLFMRILDDREPRQNSTLLQHDLADGANDLKKTVVLDRAMIDLGPFVFAKPDEHHLVESGFDLSDESRMRLDAT